MAMEIKSYLDRIVCCPHRCQFAESGLQVMWPYTHKHSNVFMKRIASNLLKLNVNVTNSMKFLCHFWNHLFVARLLLRRINMLYKNKQLHLITCVSKTPKLDEKLRPSKANVRNNVLRINWHFWHSRWEPICVWMYALALNTQDLWINRKYIQNACNIRAYGTDSVCWYEMKLRWPQSQCNKIKWKLYAGRPAYRMWSVLDGFIKSLFCTNDYSHVGFAYGQYSPTVCFHQIRGKNQNAKILWLSLLFEYGQYGLSLVGSVIYCYKLRSYRETFHSIRSHPLSISYCFFDRHTFKFNGVFRCQAVCVCVSVPSTPWLFIYSTCILCVRCR